MRRHIHAEIIKAWADGAEIEQKCADGSWRGYTDDWYPSWRDCYEYRIKPEPKPDVVFCEHFYCENGEWYATNIKDSNLKLTFDGETGELKSAEVLK